MTALTVITAVRDGARSLAGCLESVAQQGLPDLQHVVVDGASQDGTVELLRGWTRHPLEWSSAPDAGISDAFNRGLARARGAIVAILNADDRWTPGAAARALAALAAAPAAGFCFGHCLHREAGGGTWLNRGDARYRARLRYYMPDVNHPTMFIRREAYAQVGGYDLRYRYAMDYDWLLRAELAGVHGVLVDAVQAEMAMGGVSDRRWRAAYAEARRIAIRHGAPRLPAWIDHGGRLLKGGIRRTLTACGGGRLAHRVRLWRQRRVLGG